MVRARKILSRVLYWSGLLVIGLGIALVLFGARTPDAPTTGPPIMWGGFGAGIVGMALTARGATLRR